MPKATLQRPRPRTASACETLCVSNDVQDTYFVFDGKLLHVLWFNGAERPRPGSSAGAVLKHKRPGQKKTLPAQKVLAVRALATANGLRFALGGRGGKALSVTVKGLDAAGVEAAMEWLPGVLPDGLEAVDLQAPAWEAAKNPLFGLLGSWVFFGLALWASQSDFEGRRARVKLFVSLCKGLGPIPIALLGLVASIVCVGLLVRAMKGAATVQALVPAR
ncbi:MAG: hypothetical protein KDD82_20475 [Planctomycetes bacterium]|nr:hypothetical protein [Planctomycetota bacterium]